MSVTQSSNYAGRQVDVEILQSISVPAGTQEVTLSTVTKTSKIVTGVEKALQRYTVLLLTSLGDVKFAPQEGTDLLQSIASGLIYDRGTLARTFGLANNDVLAIMNSSDTDALYGEAQDDERIVSVDLTDFNVDYSTGTVMLELTFSFAAGNPVTFTIPVTAART